MPRRRRGFLDHSCYHVTHRCHKREFLLKFACDRDKYYELMLETNRRFKVSFLDFIITSNHVHFLLWSRHGEVISGAMQFLQGSFAQYYNKKHKRQGAFWSDRYHSTLIQSGEHLGRCLFYIDLNMIRAGVVKQPGKWKHTAYHELTGKRKRYRVVDINRLLKCLMMDSLVNFQRWYKLTLAEKVAGVKHGREAHWSEAVAVGDPDWLEGVYKKFKFKRKKIRPVYETNDQVESPMVSESETVYYIEG